MGIRARQYGWVAFAYFIIGLILSIALQPKPPKPRPAALEDFELPTATEDREIQVVFGEVYVPDSNVVWYGNLSTRKIKKHSLFSSQTIGFKYFLDMHMILCLGPVDFIRQVDAGSKYGVYTNLVTNNTVAIIDIPELFGGKEREGGLSGGMQFAFGFNDQTVPSGLIPHLGTNIPAFRGVVSAIWNGYVGNTPYVKPFAFAVGRYFRGWHNDEVWYEEKCQVIVHFGFPGGEGDLVVGMNPAHIIYETITNPMWGMGSPASSIDDANFRAAADQLFDEGLGLNMKWSRVTTIEEFIGLVLDHIAGILAVDQSTGKYQLILIRGDYEIDALETFDESKIQSVTSFERRSWGETINELTVTFGSRLRNEKVPVTIRDLGNIRAQGRRIPDKIELKGIVVGPFNDPDQANVNRVCARELSARSTPLSRIDFTVNRTMWRYRPGDVIKIRWDAHELPLTVFRILNLRRGTLKDGLMTVQAVEDIYSLSGIEYAQQQPEDPDPEAPPIPSDAPDNAGRVISTTLTSPPLSNLMDGDRFLVAAPATGAWAGHEGDIAIWDEDENDGAGGWVFVDAPVGTIIYDEEEGENVVTDGTGGTTPFGGGGAITIVDEDASPDEVIEPTETIFIKGAEVQDMGTGGVRIVVSPATTKGDLATRTTSGYARQPAGPDGTVLSYDSTQSTGLRAIQPPVGEAASGARVSRSSDQVIPADTLTLIEWSVEEFDSEGYWQPTTPERFTVARDGKYIVQCNVAWDLGTDQGNRLLIIRMNGGDVVAMAENESTGSFSQSVSTTLEMQADDCVEFLVRSKAPGAVDLSAQSGQPHATIARVGSLSSPTQMRGATWIRAAGADIAVPVNDVQIRVPVTGRIVGVSIGTEGGPGSCVVDVWRDTYANYPPTIADSICGGNKPTIAAASKFEDTTLAGWDVEITQGDWIFLHLESSSGFSAIFFQLHMQETQ